MQNIKREEFTKKQEELQSQIKTDQVNLHEAFQMETDHIKKMNQRIYQVNFANVNKLRQYIYQLRLTIDNGILKTLKRDLQLDYVSDMKVNTQCYPIQIISPRAVQLQNVTRYFKQTECQLKPDLLALENTNSTRMDLFKVIHLPAATPGTPQV